MSPLLKALAQIELSTGSAQLTGYTKEGEAKYTTSSRTVRAGETFTTDGATAAELIGMGAAEIIGDRT